MYACAHHDDCNVLRARSGDRSGNISSKAVVFDQQSSRSSIVTYLQTMKVSRAVLGRCDTVIAARNLDIGKRPKRRYKMKVLHFRVVQSGQQAHLIVEPPCHHRTSSAQGPQNRQLSQGHCSHPQQSSSLHPRHCYTSSPSA